MPTLTDAIQRLSAQGERRNPQSELQQLWAKYKPEIVDYVNQLNAKAGEHNRMLAESTREHMRGQGMGPATAQVLEDLAAGYNPSMLGVIKPKGGNWLAGSVEEAIKPLKRPLFPGRLPFGEDAEAIAQAIGGTPEEVLAAADPGSKALNNWLETKLAKYIRNEMATPEDPLRALAGRGISHVPEDDLMMAQGWVPEEVLSARHRAGYPSEGFAWKEQQVAGFPQGRAEDLARMAEGWENLADTAVTPSAAGDLIRSEYVNPAYGSRKDLAEKYLGENPWLAKVPPETPVYSADLSGGDLGFSHLTDELRNAINPESGLPADLMWKYSDLPKVTVPQAVERVAKINEWRAAQKIAADQARANNAATVLHKEYPEKGFKWVELKAPTAKSVEDLSPEQMTWYNEYLQGGVSPERALQEASKRTQKTLEDALKYEGDVMGHCVGKKYCPDVMEGRSRIFSLRDAKGQPHVTVEVRPGMLKDTGPKGDAAWEKFYDELSQSNPELYKRWGGNPDKMNLLKRQSPELYEKYFTEQSPSSIVQIKGKQNRAPNPEYLPFVQDFVRSGQWSDVGDLANAGLKQWTPRMQDIPSRLTGVIPRAGDIPHGYYTEDELRNLIQEWQSSQPGGRGFAQGGIVDSGNVNYNPERIDALVAQLKEELNG